MKQSSISESLMDLIEAHDSYAEKRETLEKHIYDVFNAEKIEVNHIIFCRDGFDAECQIDYYILDNLSHISNQFQGYQMGIDYSGNNVIFRFKSNS